MEFIFYADTNDVRFSGNNIQVVLQIMEFIFYADTNDVRFSGNNIQVVLQIMEFMKENGIIQISIGKNLSIEIEVQYIQI